MQNLEGFHTEKLMNTFTEKIIDSHVHLDHIHTKHPDRIEWMQSRGISTISWAFALEIKSREELKAYLKNQADTIQHLHEKGFSCFFLTGIHPRNIPQDLQAEDVEKMLTPFLNHPLCLGIGEIGLETGNKKEEEIFRSQLEMGKSLGKKMGIHTPRDNKPEITKKILSVLNSYLGIEDRIVIDHCIPKTIGSILERGFWAGITLSPAKASLHDLEQMVNSHPDALNRMMCNTDSGTIFYEDMWQLYNSDQFLPEIRNKLAFENAFQFFRGVQK